MQIGPYRVVEEIGRGGAGAVFRATAPDGRSVAIKILLKPSPDALARFDRERRLLTQLGQDAGFVPLIDFGDTQGGPFVAMPFVGGGSLRERLRKGPLTVDDVIELARRLADAMGVAHSKGIIHRDLKPENILFTSDGVPLIADLGLGKHFTQDAPGASHSISLTADGTFHGTAGYMAPEQIQAARDAGPPADVFALGAILYECLTGQPAFDGESLHEVLAKVASGSFTAIRDHRPDAPRWLAEVIARAMRPEAARRFQNGFDLAAAIKAGPQATRRGKLTLAVVASGAIALFAITAVVLTLPRGGRPVDEPSRTPSPTPSSSSSKSPEPIASTSARPASDAPTWYLALDRDERPPLPLPRGVEFGKGPAEFVNVKDKSVLLFVPRTTFKMGIATGADNERPVHDVELSAYFIGKYEVTNAQFEAFEKATKYVTAAEREGAGRIVSPRANPFLEVDGESVEGASWKLPNPRVGDAPRPDQPVAQVTWDDARAYCDWAGLQLPTEAQWECAAGWDRSARRLRRFPWGDDRPGAVGAKVANVADEALKRQRRDFQIFDGYDDGFAGPAPVGSFPDGASPIGALDMIGNVGEWCLDGADAEYYSHSPPKDPLRDPAGAQGRTVRGGSYASNPGNVSTTNRDEYPALVRYEDVGFRVCRRPN